MAAQQDWGMSDMYRQKVRQQLQEVLNRLPNRPTTSAAEIENKIYSQCHNNKERYIAAVKNVITSASKKPMMRPPMQPNQQMGMQQQNQMQANQQMPAPSVPSGMQNARQFGVTNNMSRGPPSDSPQSIGMQSPLSSGGITGYSPDNRLPHPSPGQQYYSQRGSMMQRPTPSQQNQPQLRMPDNPYPSSVPPGSVGSTYIPSLSPAQQNNSPQVASMSPALRTPGSVTVAHSPAGAAVPSPSTNQSSSSTPQNDEQLYMEKLKQLQKYIEPLSRMINRQEKDSKDLSKMKSLRDILMDSTKRLAMPTLLKCETVLQSWLPPATPPINPRQDQHMCQPILDAIASNTNAPLMNHTLKRTFGSALEAVNGDYSVPEGMCCKRPRLHKKVEEEDYEPGIKIPDIIQREVVGLGSKFKVTVDLSRSSNAGALHLVCRLQNPKLPSVPPITVLVPRAYPKEGPEWKLSNPDDYDDSIEPLKSSQPTFLGRLKPNMDLYINNSMGFNGTLSAILTGWERSVRKTCYEMKTARRA